MVDEQELRTIIENIVHEMVGDTSASSQTKSDTFNNSESQTNSSCGTDGMISDIAEVDIKRDLLVPNPSDEASYYEMKDKTPSRIGVWHTGARYMSSTALRFKADHAAAQDAVFSYVDEDFIERNNLLSTGTIVQDKDEYITRPDHGRQFSDEEKERIKQHCGNPKAQIVVGDGLSSASIEANLEDTLPAIKQGLKMNNIEAGNDIFVKHCRVPAMDVIGEVTDAEVVCLLIGERPGLVTAESMSAYIAYKPTVGMPEARRTVVSNIHQGGTPPAEAGAHIADLIKTIINEKASGLDLNKA